MPHLPHPAALLPLLNSPPNRTLLPRPRIAVPSGRKGIFRIPNFLRKPRRKEKGPPLFSTKDEPPLPFVSPKDAPPLPFIGTHTITTCIQGKSPSAQSLASVLQPLPEAQEFVGVLIPAYNEEASEVLTTVSTPPSPRYPCLNVYSFISFVSPFLAISHGLGSCGTRSRTFVLIILTAPPLS